MALKLKGASRSASSVPIMERLNAIRDRWHTKRHPFFHESAKVGSR